MRDDTLLESLTALGQLAMKEAGAAGYRLDRRDRESGALVRLQQCGAPKVDVGSAVSFPVRIAGLESHVLVFSFRSDAIPEHVVRILDQVAGVAESILRLALLPVQYSELASRAGELEGRLISAKIRDRARGLVQNPAADVETQAGFSETMLRSSQTAIMLERLAAQREEEIRERSLTTQAKAVLGSVYGMSEEQAHHHLCVASRKSRRPLREVALEYIGKRS